MRATAGARQIAARAYRAKINAGLKGFLGDELQPGVSYEAAMDSLPPDLQKVVREWEGLPYAVKVGIIAMVEAAGTFRGADSAAGGRGEKRPYSVSGFDFEQRLIYIMSFYL